MQNVIRDEVRKVHACFASTEWVMLLLLDSLAVKKKKKKKKSKSTAFLLLLRQALWP